jgi:hypothetical protein
VTWCNPSVGRIGHITVHMDRMSLHGMRSCTVRMHTHVHVVGRAPQLAGLPPKLFLMMLPLALHDCLTAAATASSRAVGLQ